MLYPRDRLVYSLNLNSGHTKPVTTFDFEPRCIQTDGDLIAVGSLQESGRAHIHHTSINHGLFAVHNRQTKQNLSLDIGDCINNSISLYSVAEPSQYKAIVCNNDFNLYFVDINNSEIQVANKTKFKVSLNHASISPDHKTIVACGDIQQLYVCHPEERSRASHTTIDPSVADKGWKVANILDSSSSFGFSTAFHDSGVIFGAAFQNGAALLYDMRNLSQSLTKISSTRPGNFIGAFRCLKFSQGFDDMVFVSEQMGRVHAVDLRDFNNHQVLMIPKKLSVSSNPAWSLSALDEDSDENEQLWIYENDPGLIRQYDEMINSGDASRETSDLGASPSLYNPITAAGATRGSRTSSAHSALLSFYGRANTSQSLRDNYANGSPFVEGEEEEDEDEDMSLESDEIEEAPSVFRNSRVAARRASSANQEEPRARPNSQFYRGLNNPVSDFPFADPFREEFISPLLSGSPGYGAIGSHRDTERRRQRSLSIGGGGLLATNRAAARRSLMQEQQLSDQYMFRGTYEPRFYASRNYVPFDELELAPDANETPSNGAGNNSNNSNTIDTSNTEASESTVASTSNTNAARITPTYTRLESPRGVPIYHTGQSLGSHIGRIATSRQSAYHTPNNNLSLSTRADLIAQAHNMSGLDNSINTNNATDYGVSGIAWTDFNGGSLVVGSDKGVGLWKIDKLASITFPNYEQR